MTAIVDAGAEDLAGTCDGGEEPDRRRLVAVRGEHGFRQLSEGSAHRGDDTGAGADEFECGGWK